ncbi:MAG: tetratricopeptide repeat protein [Phycisphaerae bacterium]|nr:tetratricopeptide repeat protein [Phycisphaerae bacterium]
MEAVRLKPIRGTLAGRWQTPVFLAGVVVFGSAIYRMSLSHQTLSFEDELQRVETLRRAGALTRLNAYLIYLMRDVERPASERAELHRRMVDAVHLAESRFETHRPQNIESIITNFDRAAALGSTMSGDDWIALADAYFWSNQPEEGIRSLRQGLRAGASRSDAVRRRLVEHAVASNADAFDDSLDDIDAIIEDARSSPGNYLWAVGLRVRWYLRKGESASALSVVDDARLRLNGTPELPMLRYYEALCLKRLDRTDEAEAIARSLRDSVETLDELWGRTGWLLGEIELDGGRPDSALALFEDVGRAYEFGPLRDGCDMGRAEAFVALNQPERALEAFAELRDGLPMSGWHEFVDRDALRMRLTTVARSLSVSGQHELGVQYLELAISLVPAGEDELRSQYLGQIALGLRSAARSIDLVSAGEFDRERYRLLHLRAAEVSLAMGRLVNLDNGRAAEAMEAAADDLDRSGEIDRMMKVLESFTARFTNEQVGSVRARVMMRLARTYQAKGRYHDAAAEYQSVISEYPRQPEALDAMVPLAECQLRLGGEAASRGEALLVDIVDDRGRDVLFTPTAREYRDALVLLCEHYVIPEMSPDTAVSEGTQDEEARLAMGITRLEDVLSLYPDDELAGRMTFLLAEAYRRSASLLSARSTPADAAARREVDRRLRFAHQRYSEVKRRLARLDSGELTALDATYLRAAYLYLGDCLFDLNDFERAVEAYRETAWRYENEPAAVAAMMQVVNCYFRMGRGEEARAALARMKWLLKKIPPEAFDGVTGMSPKGYWEDMVMRLERSEIS